MDDKYNEALDLYQAGQYERAIEVMAQSKTISSEGYQQFVQQCRKIMNESSVSISVSQESKYNRISKFLDVLYIIIGLILSIGVISGYCLVALPLGDYGINLSSLQFWIGMTTFYFGLGRIISKYIKISSDKTKCNRTSAVGLCFLAIGSLFLILTYIIHSGFISGYQNRYGDNLKPPTNVYHRMTA